MGEEHYLGTFSKMNIKKVSSETWIYGRIGRENRKSTLKNADNSPSKWVFRLHVVADKQSTDC